MLVSANASEINNVPCKELYLTFYLVSCMQIYITNEELCICTPYGILHPTNILCVPNIAQAHCKIILASFNTTQVDGKKKRIYEFLNTAQADCKKVLAFFIYNQSRWLKQNLCIL